MRIKTDSTMQNGYGFSKLINIQRMIDCYSPKNGSSIFSHKTMDTPFYFASNRNTFNPQYTPQFLVHIHLLSTTKTYSICSKSFIESKYAHNTYRYLSYTVRQTLFCNHLGFHYSRGTFPISYSFLCKSK